MRLGCEIWAGGVGGGVVISKREETIVFYNICFLFLYDSLSSLSLMPSGRYCVSGSYFTSCVCLFLCAYLSQILPFVALLAFRFSIYLCFLSVSSIFYFFPHSSGIYIFLPSVVSFIMHTLAKRAL